MIFKTKNGEQEHHWNRGSLPDERESVFATIFADEIIQNLDTDPTKEKSLVDWIRIIDRSIQNQQMEVKDDRWKIVGFAVQRFTRDDDQLAIFNESFPPSSNQLGNDTFVFREILPRAGADDTGLFCVIDTRVTKDENE